MPVMMRQQAPWVFSAGFYAGQPGKLAEFLGEMDKTTQPASSCAAQIAALINHDATGRLGSITTPALVIACEDDIVIKPALSRRLHEALPGSDWLIAAKEAVPEATVVANTGVRADTIADIFAVADAVIVGTSLKVDSSTFNPVDPARAHRLMDAARAVRT